MMEKKLTLINGTIVCAEQGIGDQILFMHSMNEAIDELGKILYNTEKRLYPIIKREVFPRWKWVLKGLHTTGQEII